MRGTLLSSSILRINKSAWKVNLPTSTSIFSTIPTGYLNDQSANLMLILVGLRVSRDCFAYKEYGIRLMLVSRSAKALHKTFLLKFHGIRKLSRSPSLGGTLFWIIAELSSLKKAAEIYHKIYHRCWIDSYLSCNQSVRLNANYRDLNLGCGTDFTEESIEKSWGKESANESGSNFIPCFDSSFVEFVQPCFCFSRSVLVLPSNWFPLTRVKWLPLIANSFAVLGIVIVESRVRATTRRISGVEVDCFFDRKKLFCFIDEVFDSAYVEALVVRNLQNELALERSKSQGYKDVADGLKVEITQFFGFYVRCIVRKLLSSDEFNATLSRVLTLGITSGVERGLHMGRTDVEFKVAAQNVSNFFVGVEAEFNKALDMFPSTLFPFLNKVDAAFGGALSKVSKILPDKIAQPATSATSMAPVTCEATNQASAKNAHDDSSSLAYVHLVGMHISKGMTALVSYAKLIGVSSLLVFGVVLWAHDTFVDVVFDGAFGGVRDDEVVVGEGVVMVSSSLDMLTNNYLGGIMVSLIFLEGLDEKALVEFMDKIRDIEGCRGSDAIEHISFTSRQKVFVDINGAYDVLTNEKMCRFQIRANLFNEKIAWIFKCKLEIILDVS
nr:hypothetical protein [Tanacetum cinerariifolium]